MKAHVDPDTCTGCGLCPELCPEVFQMQGDTASVIADPVPADAEGAAQEAAENCPVDAITVE